MVAKIEYKQLLIVRKDLGMPCGKIAVQLSRASDAIIEQYYKNNHVDIRVYNWLKDGVNKKIAKKVTSEEELLKCEQIAIENNILHHVTVDIGLTHFHGVHTKTAIAIGPDDASIIDALFGTLPLL